MSLAGTYGTCWNDPEGMKNVNETRTSNHSRGGGNNDCSYVSIRDQHGHVISTLSER